MNLLTVILQLPNPQSSTVLAIILLGLVILAFVSSGSQVAFLSLEQKDINLIKTKPQPAYKRVVDLLEKPQELLFSMQVASIFFYLGIALTSNLLIDSLIPDPGIGHGVMLGLKVITLILVIFLFCECLPKAYAAQENIRFSKDFGIITEFIYYIFHRASAWMLFSAGKLETSMFKRNNNALSNMEIDTVINKVKTDEASEEEKKILKGVLNFNKIPVKQVMRSRLDVVGLEHSLSFAEVIRKVQQIHYTKLPVYKNNLDETVGVINVRDLLLHLKDKDFDWHSVIEPAYYVHEYKLIEELLQEFVDKSISLAIVVDEFGGTSGMVTLDDIHASVIGEIKTEYDPHEKTYERLNDYNYIFNGKVKISDACKVMSLPLDTFDLVKGDSDSVAGLVLEIAGEIPAVGEKIVSGDFVFTVLEVNKNRLQKVKVSIELQD